MTTPDNTDQAIIDIAKETLTAKEYAAWHAAATYDAGYRRISLVLNISPTTARDRLARARRKLDAAIAERNS